MTAKEALAIIEFYSVSNEIAQYEMQLDFDNALRFIKRAFTEQEKKDELLDLYRLYNEFLERYYTQDRLLDKQHDLDILRELREEIEILEEEIK